MARNQAVAESQNSDAENRHLAKLMHPNTKVPTMLRRDLPFSPRMKALLRDLAPYVVVVGSVARGKPNSKDLDLIHYESDRSENRVRNIIRRHGIPFTSCWPGNWCFMDDEYEMIQQIEILPCHWGASYLKCRRSDRRQNICGVKLVVAPAEYA